MKYTCNELLDKLDEAIFAEKESAALVSKTFAEEILKELRTCQPLKPMDNKEEMSSKLISQYKINCERRDKIIKWVNFEAKANSWDYIEKLIEIISIAEANTNRPLDYHKWGRYCEYPERILASDLVLFSTAAMIKNNAFQDLEKFINSKTFYIYNGKTHESNILELIINIEIFHDYLEKTSDADIDFLYCHYDSADITKNDIINAEYLMNLLYVANGNQVFYTKFYALKWIDDNSEHEVLFKLKSKRFFQKVKSAFPEIANLENKSVEIKEKFSSIFSETGDYLFDIDLLNREP